MRSFKPNLRDWCWLMLAAAVAGVWWRESQLQEQFARRFERTQQAAAELSQISGWTIHERDGQFFLTGRTTLGLCPNCGRRLSVDAECSRDAMAAPGGETTYLWRQTGDCPRCKVRLGFVIAPSDAAGFQQWLPLPEE